VGLRHRYSCWDGPGFGSVPLLIRLKGLSKHIHVSHQMGLPVCVCVQAVCKCILPMHALRYIFLCSLWWGDLSWINFCCFGQLEFSLNLSALEISGWYTLMCAASRTCALVLPLFCRAKFSLPVLLPVVVSHWGISVTIVTAVKRCNMLFY